MTEAAADAEVDAEIVWKHKSKRNPQKNDKEDWIIEKALDASKKSRQACAYTDTKEDNEDGSFLLD